MSFRRYAYVGPESVRQSSSSLPTGIPIRSVDDLTAWIASCMSNEDFADHIIVTFVIDCDGELLLAPRRSEHVACAAGGPVLSAGEMTFSPECDIVEVSNHSTGFCPEPESWKYVAAALDRLSLSHPGAFTRPVVFRLCPECHERNIVKDDWFVCDLCGSDLPKS
jgi:hypothetical protein